MSAIYWFTLFWFLVFLGFVAWLAHGFRKSRKPPQTPPPRNDFEA